MAEEHRALYHAGLAHGANHLVTLVTQAMDLLRASGAEDPAGTLRPLLAAALDNALSYGSAALTGPIVRGDVETVRSHLADIAATEPTTLPTYVAMARATADRAVADGRLLPIRAAKLHRILDAALARAGCPLVTGRPAPVVAGSRAELEKVLGDARAAGGRVALVPTMGALHEGHAALIAEARRHSVPRDVLVVSVFVNPLQFGPGEDLDRYPRTFDADLALCADRGRRRGVRTGGDEVYPGGEPQVTVHPGPLGEVLEGASRPAHFRGVLTVVAKLFGLVRPDAAVFGEKDYQQLVLVRRMVADLCLAVEVVGADHGPRGRRARAVLPQPLPLRRASERPPLALSRALRAAADRALRGARGRARSGRGRALRRSPGLDLDYLALTSPDLGPAHHAGARPACSWRDGWAAPV